MLSWLVWIQNWAHGKFANKVCIIMDTYFVHKHTEEVRYNRANKIAFSHSLPKHSFINLLSRSEMFQVKITSLQGPMCTYILQTVNFPKKIWLLASKKYSSATVREIQTVGDSQHVLLYLLTPLILNSRWYLRILLFQLSISLWTKLRWLLTEVFCNCDLKQPHPSAKDSVALGHCRVRSSAGTSRAFKHWWKNHYFTTSIN